MRSNLVGCSTGRDHRKSVAHDPERTLRLTTLAHSQSFKAVLQSRAALIVGGNATSVEGQMKRIALGCLVTLAIVGTAYAQRNPPKKIGPASVQSGAVSSQDQLILQQRMDKKGQLESTFSNLLKQQSKTQSGVVKNMK
jgi:hypothetical protein